MIKILYFVLFSGAFIGCQVAPTQVSENDKSFESRAFSKVRYGEKFDLTKSVIVDTRSRFDHEMSRPPRSFHVFWKDWSLKNYNGAEKDRQRQQLQKQLALKGIDPLTRIVILGKGLQGEGEEFLVASTLISLGVRKINFVNEGDLKKSLVSLNVPKLENLPFWEKSLDYDFDCKGKKQTGDIHVGGESHPAEQFFNRNLSLKKTNFPKSLNLKVGATKGLWAYGIAIHLMQQGRKVCVVRP